MTSSGYTKDALVDMYPEGLDLRVASGLFGGLHNWNDSTANDEPLNEPVNERQKWFLTQLRQRFPVKAENIMQRWGVSLATVKRDLAELRKLELIEFTGSAKTGSYRLKQKRGESMT